MRRVMTAMITLAAGIALAAAAGPRSSRPPSEVLRPPDEAAPLQARLDWALGRPAQAPAGRTFWVGYGIDRLMGERSHIGSFHDGGRGRDLTVADILAGRKETSAADIPGAAKAALDDIDSRGRPEKQVLKELGFFFKFESGATPVLTDVSMSNLDLAFDFEAAPLYWLGKTEAGESMPLIKRFFARARDEEVREGLLAAAGCHGDPALAVPFLAEVLGGDAADRLRKDAAFWIGQLASKKAGPALEEFARKDGDIEIQEQAVFALSQLEDNEGVEPLIKLAKTHPDPRIRKKAVFWLGECDDPRALETLIAIIKGK